MDGTDIALRVIGAFYAFAGLVTARMGLTSNLVDHAIAAIAMQKPDRIEIHRTIWLLSLSTLTFSSGICLMLLLAPAVWLFVLCAFVQALYFVALGPYYFDAAEPPDPLGRRRSVNAFVLYCAASAFVVWAAYVGRLIPIADASGWLLGAAAAAIALHVGYIIRHMMFPTKRKSAFGDFDDGSTSDYVDDTPLDQTRLPASSKRFKLMADYGTYPLWAMDDGLIGDFSPQDLSVSEELTSDLWAWANNFELSLNPDDPANSRWSADRYKQHVAEGLALARRIKRELPEREVFVHDEKGDLIEIKTADGDARL
jgi:hypothetical protein